MGNQPISRSHASDPDVKSGLMDGIQIIPTSSAVERNMPIRTRSTTQKLGLIPRDQLAKCESIVDRFAEYCYPEPEGRSFTIPLDKTTLLAVDEIRGNRCYVTDKFVDDEKVVWLRAFIKESFSGNGFVGFSDQFDRYFDDYSRYFYVVNSQGKLVSSVRFVHKTINNLLPFETGIVCTDPPSRYVTMAENAGEVVSLVFSDMRSVKLLLSGLAHYGKAAGIQISYCLGDPKSSSWMAFHSEYGFIKSIKFDSLIYFPGYGRIDHGHFRPSLWRILEMTSSTILTISYHLSSDSFAFKV